MHNVSTTIYICMYILHNSLSLTLSIYIIQKRINTSTDMCAGYCAPLNLLGHLQAQTHRHILVHGVSSWYPQQEKGHSAHLKPPNPQLACSKLSSYNQQFA